MRHILSLFAIFIHHAIKNLVLVHHKLFLLSCYHVYVKFQKIIFLYLLTESGVHHLDPVEFLSEDCASRISVMALGVTTALLVVLYVCTVAYFVAQSRAQKEIRE